MSGAMFMSTLVYADATVIENSTYKNSDLTREGAFKHKHRWLKVDTGVISPRKPGVILKIVDVHIDGNNIYQDPNRKGVMTFYLLKNFLDNGKMRSSISEGEINCKTKGYGFKNERFYNEPDAVNDTSRQRSYQFPPIVNGNWLFNRDVIKTVCSAYQY